MARATDSVSRGMTAAQKENYRSDEGNQCCTPRAAATELEQPTTNARTFRVDDSVASLRPSTPLQPPARAPGYQPAQTR